MVINFRRTTCLAYSHWFYLADQNGMLNISVWIVVLHYLVQYKPNGWPEPHLDTCMHLCIFYLDWKINLMLLISRCVHCAQYMFIRLPQCITPSSSSSSSSSSPSSSSSSSSSSSPSSLSSSFQYFPSSYLLFVFEEIQEGCHLGATKLKLILTTANVTLSSNMSP